MVRTLFVMLLALVLASCKLPSLVPPLSSSGVAPARLASSTQIAGRIVASSGVQAGILDIAKGASVALIDAATGLTLSTTVTNPDGTFFLQFAEGFVPVDARPYILEAFKGIKGANPDYNQAGADTMRLRTLLTYREAEKGWVSLANAAPGPIDLTMSTTAVSVAIAHMSQAGTPVDPTLFIGCLNGDAYDEAARPLSLVAFTALRAEVEKAITEDRDPLHYVVYDSKTGSFLSSFVAFAVSEITPSSGNIGTLLDIRGDGFTSGPLEMVTINGTQAEIQPGTLAEDRVVVKVLPGTRTGPVSIVINGVVQAGPTFTVTMTDGHRSVRGETLYVANPAWGTVAEVKPNGEIRTLRSGLSTPRQAVVGPDDLIYVSNEGDNTVVRFDAAGGAFETFSTAVTKPYGLAFDGAGKLHVSSRQAAGSVVKLDAAGNAAATVTGLALPEAIAFNAGGDLFVAEDAGSIRRVPAGSLTPEAYSFVATPMGLAVDSAGDLYVASNDNSVVYRIGANRALTVFAMLNRPGGLTFDPNGNLYVSDTERNLINRVSPSGDVRVLAYGISMPRGLAVDPTTHKVYVSLNRSNAILEIDGDVLRPFVTGIANPLTLTYRGSGLYIGQPEIDTISFVTTPGGRLSTVASGISEASGADASADGTVYAGRWGREDAWQPNRNPIYEGGFQSLDPLGVLQPIRYPYVRKTRFRAIAPDDTVYESSHDERTIAKITPHANGSRTVEQLWRSDTERPRHIVLDASGNLYVSFLDQDKVVRFRPPAYAPEAITGFSQPFGLALHPGADAVSLADDKLYVYNRGNGFLSWINNPSVAATKTADSAGPSTGIATAGDTYGLALALKPGDDGVYLAAQRKVVRYDIGDGLFASYLTKDLPIAITEIKAWPDGTLFARPENEDFVTISPSLVVTQSRLRSYGGAKNWKDDVGRTLFQGDSYGHQIWRGSETFLGALGRTFEVAVDGSSYLYLAGAGTRGDTGTDYGGLFRYELSGASPKELYVPIGKGRVYSLVVASDRTVYAGSGDQKIYQVDLNGAVTPKWSLGTLPYGLDRDGDTLWVVGENNRIFSFARTLSEALTPPSQTYGIMEPVF